MVNYLCSNKKRIIYGVLLFIWMVTIFYFSSQNGDDSQSTSDVITYKIVGLLNISDKETENAIKEIISFIVRKSAHFSIYFIGGFIIYGFLKTFGMMPKNLFYMTILFGFLYSVSDEIHQYFVPGRAAQIRDIFIDTFGIFAMAIIRLMIDNRLNSKKN